MAGLREGERDQAGQPLSIGSGTVKPRVVRIPDDQKQLLDSAESWFENLRQHPHGHLNIPGSVYTGLIQLEERKKERATRHQQPSPTQPPARLIDKHSPSAQVVHHKAPRSRELETTPKSTTRKDVGSDADSATSWSASPSRQEFPSPTPPRISPVTKEDKLAPRPQPVRREPINYPSSDGGSQPELDIEVPGAIRAAPGAVDPPPQQQVLNIPGLESNSSTPSAQIMPSNCHGTRTPADKSKRRVHLHKKLDFSETQVVEERQTFSPLGLTPSNLLPSLPDDSRRGPSVLGVLTMPQQTPSNEWSHSTTKETPAVLPVSPFPRQPSRSPTRKTYGPRESLEVLISVQQGERVQHGDASGSDSASVHATNMDETIIVPPTLETQSPFRTYSKAYPDYTGNEDDFIRGVSYVGSQQASAQLASFLYDDVIRAFSEDFIPYLQHTIEDPPMVLWKWYNRHVKTLRYKRNIVTSDTLDGILRFYEKEIAVIVGQPQDLVLRGWRHSTTSRSSSRSVQEDPEEAQNDEKTRVVSGNQGQPLRTSIPDATTESDHAMRATTPTRRSEAEATPVSSSPPPSCIPDSQATVPSGAAGQPQKSLQSNPSPRLTHNTRNTQRPGSSSPLQKEHDMILAPEHRPQERGPKRFFISQIPPEPSSEWKRPRRGSFAPESSYAQETRLSQGPQVASPSVEVTRHASGSCSAVSPASSMGGKVMKTMTKAELEKRSARFKRHLEKKYGSSRPVSARSSFRA